MKKIILILITIATTNSTYAQLDKKTWLVCGSGSFSSTISTVTYTSDITPGRFNGYIEKSKVFNLNLSPSIGYFFLDKFAFGLRPTITWKKSEGFDGTNGRSLIPGFNRRDFVIGPFARFYFLKKEKPFNLLLESNYQLGIVKQLDDTQGITKNLTLLAGTVIYFNQSVGLEFLIGYNRYQDRQTFLHNNELQINNYTQKGLQFNIGLQFHLEKK